MVEIPSALHDVDFSTRGPSPVLIVLRQHPNGRPQPVTLRQFGSDLKPAILERVLSFDECRLDRVEDMCSVTHPLTPIESIARASVSVRAAPEIHPIATADRGLPNFVLEEDGLDVEHSVFNKRSGSIIVIELELPVSTSTESYVMRPLCKVQFVEVILEN